MYFSNLTSTFELPKIIERSREYGKISKGIVGSHSLMLPAIALHSADGGMYWHYVTVPTDTELIELAHRMIENPQSIIPEQRKPNETETYQIRYGAVDALQHFETEDNIAILKEI